MYFCMLIDTQSTKTMQLINPAIATGLDQFLCFGLRLFCCSDLRASLLIEVSIDAQQNMLLHIYSDK